MSFHIHHVHLFASDIEASIRFYCEHFGGEVVLDAELAGARNVFIRVGQGRLHLYDQPPRTEARGAIHHFGIQTDDVAGAYERLKAAGVSTRKPVTDAGLFAYIMVPAPDGVLIELFEVNRDVMPEAFSDYFA